MKNARIYHYTTVETLALMLESKKLRFSRLDGVDDVREAQRHSGINFGKYFFVSCWTLREEESIPQWHMYTDQMRGVRVSMPAYPFQRKRLALKPEWIGESSGELLAPLSFEEQYTDSYFVLPMFLADEQFAGPVEYVNDIESRYAAAVNVERHHDGSASVTMKKLSDLVRLKSKEWGFQAEFRFHLLALPSFPLPPQGPGSPEFYTALPAHVTRCLLSEVDPGVNYIDVDVAEGAFEDLEIAVGPLCSPGAKLCVEALVQRYAPKAVVRESSLTGRIRHRNR